MHAWSILAKLQWLLDKVGVVMTFFDVHDGDDDYGKYGGYDGVSVYVDVSEDNDHDDGGDDDGHGCYHHDRLLPSLSSKP